MNQIINSPTVITEKTGWTVFLAGPMKASPRGWRNKLAKRYGVKVHTSMEGCLEELKAWIEKSKPKVHYIAAPGFDSKEQLAAHPEFVDLLAMNQTLMERWNRMVAPGDKVYVVGEFGNEEWMKLVNGDVQIVDPSADGAPAGIRLI